MAHPDFEELLAAFDAHKVRYLIGGAHAVALHPRPRATKDLDLYLAATRANARRVIRAVAEFFGGTAPSYVSVENLLDPDMLIQLGVAPVRVDLLHEPEAQGFFEGESALLQPVSARARDGSLCSRLAPACLRTLRTCSSQLPQPPRPHSRKCRRSAS